MILQIIMAILCQRVFSFIKKNCNNKIPKPGKFNANDIALIENIKKMFLIN